ncbi:hypothetical protein CXG81DRAFT_17619 [Caulochytrium protostelioides]|uniref:Uncharacterized protein n=1 Tax=Caulochytrium protostelioides TaxID=1555241 RepID=A0A4P9XBD8_9FUNG|nr:hypothetical protein CXG81DRAFT_17619 [Caulochytrium protostelioides]|eukprot:RKP02734.1 hypothetical protein CXG81DRAFT_17619 [Caulochytrium protostelioides]
MAPSAAAAPSATACSVASGPRSLAPTLGSSSCRSQHSQASSRHALYAPSIRPDHDPEGEGEGDVADGTSVMAIHTRPLDDDDDDDGTHDRRSRAPSTGHDRPPRLPPMSPVPGWSTQSGDRDLDRRRHDGHGIGSHGDVTESVAVDRSALKTLAMAPAAAAADNKADDDADNVCAALSRVPVSAPHAPTSSLWPAPGSPTPSASCSASCSASRASPLSTPASTTPTPTAAPAPAPDVAASPPPPAPRGLTATPPHGLVADVSLPDRPARPASLHSAPRRSRWRFRIKAPAKLRALFSRHPAASQAPPPPRPRPGRGSGGAGEVDAAADADGELMTIRPADPASSETDVGSLKPTSLDTRSRRAIAQDVGVGVAIATQGDRRSSHASHSDAVSDTASSPMLSDLVSLGRSRRRRRRHRYRHGGGGSSSIRRDPSPHRLLASPGDGDDASLDGLGRRRTGTPSTRERSPTRSDGSLALADAATAWRRGAAPPALAAIEAATCFGGPIGMPMPPPSTAPITPAAAAAAAAGALLPRPPARSGSTAPSIRLSGDPLHAAGIPDASTSTTTTRARPATPRPERPASLASSAVSVAPSGAPSVAASLAPSVAGTTGTAQTGAQAETQTLGGVSTRAMYPRSVKSGRVGYGGDAANGGGMVGTSTGGARHNRMAVDGMSTFTAWSFGQRSGETWSVGS